MIETYYIVNNTFYELYCLPVAIIKNVGDMNLFCSRTKPKIMPNLSTITKIQVIGDNGLIDYNSDVMSQVLGFIQNSVHEFSIVSSIGQKYEIDLLKKTQMNLKTGFVRKIVIT